MFKETFARFGLIVLLGTGSAGCIQRGPQIRPVDSKGLNEISLFTGAKVRRADTCYLSQDPNGLSRGDKVGLRKTGKDGSECLGALELESLDSNVQIPASDISFLKETAGSIVARLLATDGQVFTIPYEAVVGSDDMFTDGEGNRFTLNPEAGKGNIVGHPVKAATPISRNSTPQPQPTKAPQRPGDPTLAPRPTIDLTYLPTKSAETAAPRKGNPQAAPGMCYDSYGDPKPPKVEYSSASGPWLCTGLYTTGTEIIVSEFVQTQTGESFFVVTNIYDPESADVYRGEARMWLELKGYEYIRH